MADWVARAGVMITLGVSWALHHVGGVRVESSMQGTALVVSSGRGPEVRLVADADHAGVEVIGGSAGVRLHAAGSMASVVTESGPTRARLDSTPFSGAVGTSHGSHAAELVSGLTDARARVQWDAGDSWQISESGLRAPPVHCRQETPPPAATVAPQLR